MLRPPLAPVLFAALLLSAACGDDRGDALERSDETSAPTGAADPGPATDSEPVASEIRYAGAEACRPCHAEIVESVAASAHARAAWSIDDVPEGLGDDPEALAGATHGLGGLRRAVLLERRSGTLAVTTRAWTEAAGWHDAADDATPMLQPVPFGSQCARCHPIPGLVNARDLPLAPPESASLPAGVGCESCHGPAAAHAENPSHPLAAIGSLPWRGCAHCHAQGAVLPRHGERPLLPGEPLTDHVLPTILAMPTGASNAYFLDGRPSTAHAMATQALAQSQCFQVGGATCTTCHDPHGGGLRESDPDASCRNCHASIASALAEHSRHPAPRGPVPNVREESEAAAANRAPGCVDCHAPAILRLGPGEAARDHAFGAPHPTLTALLGLPNACSNCHADDEPTALVAAIDRWFPDRESDPPRVAWANAFARGFATLRPDAPADARADAARLLAGVLADDAADPWTRASAAELLGGLGIASDEARQRLSEILRDAEDPVLLQRAAVALGRVGGPVEPIRELLERSDDWRVRLSAASGLIHAREPRGLDELERLRRDESLPVVGRGAVTAQLGLALLHRGVGRRAELLLAEATRMRPDDVAAWLNLGTARVALGDDEGAHLAWQAVLDLDPGNPYALSNLESLAEKDRSQAEAER